MAAKGFPRSVDTIGEVYRFSEELMAAQDVHESVRFPVHLALEELFVNLVTYNPGATRDIMIDVAVEGSRVIVTITDQDAAEFDVTRDPQVDTDASLSERRPGGLGLHLIQRMVDTLEYDYREGRSRIRFSKEQATNDV